jgi:CheY-like chemotaxis protein
MSLDTVSQDGLRQGGIDSGRAGSEPAGLRSAPPRRRSMAAAAIGGAGFLHHNPNGHFLPGWGPVVSDQPESLRVLVVDDDIRVADSLAKILTASGHEAVPAYSAEAAMKLAARLAPHAVISDIVMGPVSGIELANHIRENFPGCKVLLISGHTSANDFGQKLLTRSSSLQFASKPVAPDRILEFVASCRAAKAPMEPAGS